MAKEINKVSFEIEHFNGNFYDADIDKHEWFEKAIGITKEEMEQINFEF